MKRVQIWIFGAVVLALLGLPASALTISATSIHSSSYGPEFAFDGRLDTRWASGPATKAQYLQIDLGKECAIETVRIRWEAAFAVAYSLQTSLDGRAWRTLVHETAGDGDIDQHESLQGKGRYLRIVCEKPGPHPLYSIWEVELPEVAALAARRAQQRRLDLRDLTDTQGVKEVVFAVREDGRDGHWYANFGYYAPDCERKAYSRGGRLCRLNLERGELSVLVDDPEGTIRDPTVHYDAQKILFSWRKAGSEAFHLYEIDSDGGNIRQLTDGKYDDIEPCYLPDGGIMFVSGRAKRYVNCWLTQVAVLHRCDADGSNIRQISANIEHDNTPWPLPNGQVIYQRWEYVDRSQVTYHHLWTANPDGTGHMIYYGNQRVGGLFIDPKPIPGTDKILFINSPGHGAREHSGHVAIVSNHLGPDADDALQNITKGRDFRDPWPLAEDLFLVARGRQLLLMDDTGATLDLYELPKAFGSAKLQEPRPLVSRVRERVIAPATDLSKSTGKLILANVYRGRNMAGVKPGEIKKLLVLESLPKPINYTGGMDPLTYGGSFTLERLVGTIPVEDDGSAFMELPANRAFFFVALDKDNNSVKRMQSFTSVAPGEVVSCAGCHEQRNRAPGAIQNFGELIALTRPANTPEPLKGIPEVIDFPRHIQPILDRHCLNCHDYDKRQGGVILTGDRGPIFSHSYATLTILRQVADGRNAAASNYAPRKLGTSASALMKKIDGSHYQAALSAHEQDLIRYWIESAATYPGTYAALGCGSIGGYVENRQVHDDKDWPSLPAFQTAMGRRCIDCHRKQLQLPLPRRIADEMGISFWRPNWDDKRLRFSRHLMFNLSRPDNSMLLLAPLAKSAGGLGLCSEPVFSGSSAPDYQAMLAHIRAGKTYLETKSVRFDMPHFQPTEGYLREMTRYGVLPPDFSFATANLDVYAIDQAYWKSLWYRPE
jgi:hypothetical protein